MNLNTIFKRESASFILIIIGIFFIVFALITFLWLDYNIDLKSQINAEKFAQFGDFIGGLVGSIWALAGVLLFYIALTEQRKEIKINQEALKLQINALNQQVREFELQRKELESSRKIYEEQNKTLKTQQFESTFYSLLKVHTGIKDKLDGLQTGIDFFKKIFQELVGDYDPKTRINIHHNGMVEKYSILFNVNRGYLAHYFKSFYRILKIIDSNQTFDNKEKTFYAKILRSQLTDYEQLILYYNSHSVYGQKSQPLILKYNLLKHLPIFNKPEFSYFLNIQKNSDILTFADYLNQFLSKHINESYDLAFEQDRIVETFMPFNCLVGIFFQGTRIDLKVFCKKDISENKIFLSGEQFHDFLLTYVFEKIVFNTYLEPKVVKLSKYLTETDEGKEFGISIETETRININTDKF
jgi:hypothetical protein